jgi:hypothetical protein
MTKRIAAVIETGSKKVFATAVDWPGWSRAGKNEELALGALVAYAERYSPIVRRAGLDFDVGAEPEFEVVERNRGSGATDFGIPSHVTDQDKRPASEAVAKRLVALVEAAWATFDEVAAIAPTELRKGPRGGGRDTPTIIEHVLGSDQAYATNMGIKFKSFETNDRDALASVRRAMVDILRRPSDGAPISGRKWTTRYAAHRIAWHALDHAWEIEDRSDPMG